MFLDTSQAHLVSSEIDAFELAVEGFEAGVRIEPASLFDEAQQQQMAAVSAVPKAPAADTQSIADSSAPPALTNAQQELLDRMQARQTALIDSLMAAVEIAVRVKEEWLAKHAVQSII